MILSRISTSPGAFRSSATDSLPRLAQTKYVLSPWTSESYPRAKSPPSGRSTLMTLAPESASRQLANGAASACSRQTTRVPERVLGIASPHRVGLTVLLGRIPGKRACNHALPVVAAAPDTEWYVSAARHPGSRPPKDGRAAMHPGRREQRHDRGWTSRRTRCAGGAQWSGRDHHPQPAGATERSR